MERPAVVVSMEQSLQETMDALQKKEVTVGFVVDEFRRVLGTISEEDALAAVENSVGQMSEVLRREFPCCPPTATLDECLQLVAEHDAPLAVVNNRGHLLGVATKTALIQAMRTDEGNGNEH